jgi:murein DD-endopeptidase MepM/ murein hydrolase activator NlpD
MPLTRTRTPAIDDHAIPARHRRTRWTAAAAAALLMVGAGTTAALGGIEEAGEVTEPAERIVTTGDGLPFPMDPTPLCLVFNNFGGYSGVNGAGGHQGVDIGATEGQEVYAVGDGVLEEQILIDPENLHDPRSPAGYGWKLRVFDPELGEMQFRYYHLSAFADGLEEGSIVAEGQVIGYVGDTGNATPGGHHLHFEIRPGPPQRYGTPPPVDPVPLLDIPTVCTIY